jgi:hypothetical protein
MIFSNFFYSKGRTKKLLGVANLTILDLLSHVGFLKKYVSCSKLPSGRLISNDHQFLQIKSTLSACSLISNTFRVLKKLY